MDNLLLPGDRVIMLPCPVGILASIFFQGFDSLVSGGETGTVLTVDSGTATILLDNGDTLTASSPYSQLERIAGTVALTVNNTVEAPQVTVTPQITVEPTTVNAPVTIPESAISVTIEGAGSGGDDLDPARGLSRLDSFARSMAHAMAKRHDFPGDLTEKALMHAQTLKAALDALDEDEHW